MSFRKRNVIISRGPPGTSQSHPSLSTTTPTASPQPTGPPPGVRSSPINGQYTTSTGTPSLDSLFAGHSGLPLGCSLLIEEPGTTDYGGALLRYYAAEGIVQGHAVTVVGFDEHWVRELPAVVGDAERELDEDRKKRGRSREEDRMKIAWRYERLGEFGSGIGGSRAQTYTPNRAPVTVAAAADSVVPASKATFCHAFDLTKRLAIPSSAKLTFIPAPSPAAARSSFPFTPILTRLSALLAADFTIHRLIIPSLLNPVLYPPHASKPQHLIQFMHSLRALLRHYPKRLTLMISLPTELYPRTTGLIRWLEILSDGVVELLPLPRRTAAKVIGKDEPQGLVKLWKLPVLGEKGGGVGAALGAGEDLAFLVTRRRFEIMAYSLPPASDDGEEDQGRRGVESEGMVTKVDLEF